MNAKQRGEDLRKIINKQNHEIKTEEEKSKYFQQLMSEMTIDIENAKAKRESLLKQIAELGQMLKEKDKQIFDEEKAVK